MDLGSGCIENKVLIREYDRDRDLEVVENLERNCEIGSRGGYSIITNMMGDPLCRVRLYHAHVMLVAELVGDGEVAGVVRSCIKCVGTGLAVGNLRMGCILGLRISPNHRRMGIGSALIKSIEGWAIRNGAQYISLATEENNIASIELFVRKFNYTKFNSLAILVEPVNARPNKNLSHDANIEKLSVAQAISLYKSRLGGEVLFPVDIDAILHEQLSLGTWVCYLKGECWSGLHCQEKDADDDFLNKTPSSWAILSMWKTYQSYKLQIKGAPQVRCFHMGSEVLPCLRTSPSSQLFNGPFGFLFLYGLHGEGEKMGDLLRSLWGFASNMASMVRDCKVIVSDLGAGDPLIEHVQSGPSVSRIDDLWLMKGLNCGDGYMSNHVNLAVSKASSNVFVDPRDF